MAELTDQQKVARAQRAKAAMEEFFDPALAAVEAEYGERMIKAAASTDPRAPEVIARLANGIKVARTIRGLIETHIAAGEFAAEQLRREKALQELTPTRKRLVGIK